MQLIPCKPNHQTRNLRVHNLSPRQYAQLEMLLLRRRSANVVLESRNTKKQAPNLPAAALDARQLLPGV